MNFHRSIHLSQEHLMNMESARDSKWHQLPRANNMNC